MLKNRKLKITLEHSCLFYLGVFFLFLLFASIANWSLLLNENQMKWDIWGAEYPFQIIMTDALADGTLPLWNPLMQYGTPHYAMVGTPVWYPITLLLAMIGYTPFILSFSYVIHIAIGGFGMFLLSQKELRQTQEKWSIGIFTASFITGLLYCGSGIFLSNAEHIMIIISAAWIPYVFFFMRKYLEEQLLVYAMMVGAVAGMIFLGGYPELFYDMFLFLAPYTLYFQYDKQKDVIHNFFSAVTHYVIVCIFTVLCSAISLFPFLNLMNSLTRTNGLGQLPGCYDLNSFISFLLPKAGTFGFSSEISMTNYYMGVITILLMPAILKMRNKNRNFYFGMSFVALLLCMSSFSFLHGLFYRFLPMYSSFRFPTITRCFLTMFILLIVVKALWEIIDQGTVFLPAWFAKVVFFVILISAVVSGMIGNMANESFVLDSADVLNFSTSAYIAAIIIGGYLVLLYSINEKHIVGGALQVGLCGLVIIDLLTFHRAEMPSTIALFDDIQYSYDQNVQEQMRENVEENQNRNRIIDFSHSPRTAHDMNSIDIVFNKFLDEDGYVSIKLQNVQDYKETYLRSIMKQNPEAYFTNDIVTAMDVDFYDWANDGGVPPEQIYVDGEGVNVSQKVRFQQKELENTPLTMVDNGDSIVIEETIFAKPTERLRLYYDNCTKEIMNMAVTFCDESGLSSQYEGEYLVYENGNGYYVDIYLPDVTRAYSNISILSENGKPDSVALVYVEPLWEDEYVDINSFRFNSMTLTVDAPSEGYVAVLQSKYNGWKAYVDGEETEITLIDNCFMGIKVSEGNHDIVMKFRPLDFFIGAIVSFSFFIALGGMMVYYHFDYKCKNNFK